MTIKLLHQFHTKSTLTKSRLNGRLTASKYFKTIELMETIKYFTPVVALYVALIVMCAHYSYAIGRRRGFGSYTVGSRGGFGILARKRLWLKRRKYLTRIHLLFLVWMLLYGALALYTMAIETYNLASFIVEDDPSMHSLLVSLSNHIDIINLDTILDFATLWIGGGILYLSIHYIFHGIGTYNKVRSSSYGRLSHPSIE